MGHITCFPTTRSTYSIEFVQFIVVYSRRASQVPGTILLWPITNILPMINMFLCLTHSPSLTDTIFQPHWHFSFIWNIKLILISETLLPLSSTWNIFPLILMRLPSTVYIPAQISLSQRSAPALYQTSPPPLHLVLVYLTNFRLFAWYMSVADISVLLINLLVYHLHSPHLPPCECGLLISRSLSSSLLVNPQGLKQTWNIIKERAIRIVNMCIMLIIYQARNHRHYYM